MRREKRLRRVVSYIPPSKYEQLELLLAEESNVVSMSDYLHDVIDRHIEKSIRISKQTTVRSVGNS